MIENMDAMERQKLAEENPKFDAAWKKACELAGRTGDNHAVISTADGRFHAIPYDGEKTLTALLKIVNGKFYDLVK